MHSSNIPAMDDPFQVSTSPSIYTDGSHTDYALCDLFKRITEVVESGSRAASCLTASLTAGLAGDDM